MISRALAEQLRPHLTWEPRNGDQFYIPRPEISDAVFTVSDMVVELVNQHGESRFHFNGTVEWALDSVASDDVVWLPNEGQLRDLLGHWFLSLDRSGEQYVVTLGGPQQASHTEPAESAADAYGQALLGVLTSPMADSSTSAK